MRFDFQNSWLRIFIECWPRVISMRRYRLARAADVAQARRRIVRRIQRQLRTAHDNA